MFLNSDAGSTTVPFDGPLEAGPPTPQTYYSVSGAAITPPTGFLFATFTSAPASFLTDVVLPGDWAITLRAASNRSTPVTLFYAKVYAETSAGVFTLLGDSFPELTPVGPLTGGTTPLQAVNVVHARGATLTPGGRVQVEVRVVFKMLSANSFTLYFGGNTQSFVATPVAVNAKWAAWTAD
jgi:hypothetical protein